MERSNFLFVDLQGLTTGKPFPGFAAGNFIDMFGNEVELKASDLQDFITNTLTQIKGSIEKGMPGLPIDASKHDKGDAAGWITGAELGEVEDSDGAKIPTISILAEWTSLGAEKIKQKIQANFSPTVDLENKVIVGGSLTNWPASVDANGVPLFTAIELSQGIRYLSQAKGDFVPPAGFPNDWFKLEMNSGESVVITPLAKPDEDPPKWYNKLKSDLQSFVESNISSQVVTPEVIGEGDDQMAIELTQEQLDETIKTAVDAAVAKSEKGKVDLSELASVLNLNTEDAANSEIKHLEEIADLMQKQEQRKYQVILARNQRENQFAELSLRVTGGSEDYPRGIPADAENLKSELMKLDPEGAKFWAGVLEDTVKSGLNDFAELGHGNKTKVKREVPEHMESSLYAVVEAGNKPEAFFAELGMNADDYDLTKFEGAKS